MAALEAEILSDCLTRQAQIGGAYGREYLRRVDACADIAWTLSSGENSKYPQTTGQRPRTFPAMRRYRDSLATSGDPKVMREVWKVITLTAHPWRLLRPDIQARHADARGETEDTILNSLRKTGRGGHGPGEDAAGNGIPDGYGRIEDILRRRGPGGDPEEGRRATGKGDAR